MEVMWIVEDVKPVGLSGTKRGNMYENANELETNNKNKSIKDLCRGINLKKVTNQEVT
jgi:hypothetical protein